MKELMVVGITAHIVPASIQQDKVSKEIEPPSSFLGAF
jgi:hypothetical protein